MKKSTIYLILFGIIIGAFYLAPSAHGNEVPVSKQFPLPIHSYNDAEIEGTWAILKHRIEVSPFNLIATVLFLCAIVHTFLASRFEGWAHRLNERHKQQLIDKGRKNEISKTVCFKAEICHFLGEIEACFALWVIPLGLFVISFYDWKTFVSYVDGTVNYTEPVFVVVVMAIASTRPVLKFAERCLRLFAKLGRCSPGAWWLSILTIGPLLGSFITEPAAMTIAALLLARQFYNLRPPAYFCYATLGLLFVNISVGGTLSHFAAPPVLMVAGVWNWDTAFMFTHFGWKAATGIGISNILYFFIFRKELKELKSKALHQKGTEAPFITGAKPSTQDEMPVPFIVTIFHLLFLAWTVFNLHHPPLFLGGFLLFLGFTQVTLHHQQKLELRSPLLVGLFLAGLVTHGGLQQWWIQPVLQSLSELPLFLGSIILTAFNDNAAITYLATLVPSFDGNLALQKAVVEGAVTGGGLTVIANAPNPAGQSILSRFFEGGISPLKLLLGALAPTAIMASCFLFL